MATWIVYAVLSAFFAALTAIFAKAGLKNINSDLATAIRTSIILIITWGIVLGRGLSSEINSFSRANWLFLTLSALATGASWIFYYRALQLGTASQVTAIDKGSIIFTVLLAFFFLKEPITPRILAGAVLVVAGTLLMVWKS